MVPPQNCRIAQFSLAHLYKSNKKDITYTLSFAALLRESCQKTRSFFDFLKRNTGFQQVNQENLLYFRIAALLIDHPIKSADIPTQLSLLPFLNDTNKP